MTVNKKILQKIKIYLSFFRKMFSIFDRTKRLKNEIYVFIYDVDSQTGLEYPDVGSHV